MNTISPQEASLETQHLPISSSENRMQQLFFGGSKGERKWGNSCRGHEEKHQRGMLGGFEHEQES